MTTKTKMYIAGIGMVTPVGGNANMSAAAVKAGISAYTLSHFDDQQGSSVTMAGVPDDLFSTLQVNIATGIEYRDQYDRIIKMATLALQDVFSKTQLDLTSIQTPIPLILSMPEPQSELQQIDAQLLIEHMIKLSGAPVDINQVRCIHSGRAAGIDSLDLAYRYLDESEHDYVLIGGSDSYWSMSLIDQLDKAERVLTETSRDGFAPGEAAGFLLLTRHSNKALQKNQHIIKLHPPGIAEEPGHFSSDTPYQGYGLDKAFKQALNNNKDFLISTVYSSMNGENFWAKEYGVSILRNHKKFQENYATEHPADCYGDIGAATGSVLIGLSAIDLLQKKTTDMHLVYSSSDGPKRAAVCVEKVALI